MLTCPKCHAGVPEGMRFCLQCGFALEATPPPAARPVEADPLMPMAPATPPTWQAEPAPMFAPPQPADKPSPPVPLKIAPPPVVAPRAEAFAPPQRPSLGDMMVEVDDELLKKSFERQVIPPGTVVCRFCKGPLDLGGDFCEQCGAPVEEAAPPGALKPQPQAAAQPPLLDDDPLSPPATPAQPSAGSTAGQHPSSAPTPGAQPPAPVYPTATRTPIPFPTTPPPNPPPEEQPSGLMGRLKGLFKKG